MPAWDIGRPDCKGGELQTLHVDAREGGLRILQKMYSLHLVSADRTSKDDV